MEIAFVPLHHSAVNLQIFKKNLIIKCLMKEIINLHEKK